MATRRRSHKAIKRPSSRARTFRQPKTPKELFALSKRDQQQRTLSLHVISKMRTGLSLPQAARIIGIDPKAVRRFVGPALRKDKRGRWVATKSDTMLRVITIPGPRGQREIPTKNSGTASTLGKYHNATRLYVHEGDATAVKKFRGLKLLDARGRRIALVTNLRKLDELGHAGLLSFDIIYSKVA